MKTSRIISAFILLLVSPVISLRGESVNLHDGWKFRQARSANWYPATVPGVVHLDLMDNGIIEDPFFGMNERAVQWVDKEDWIYETLFDRPAGEGADMNYVLKFDGLDTYADVTLNDSLILKADNMFRRWEVDVTGILRDRDNKLTVYFHSPMKVDLPKWHALPYQYDAGNDQSQNGGMFNRRLSVFARKAGYHYGWDWGPRLVPSGIWRPVTLEALSGARITDVHYLQREVNKKRADLESAVELEVDREGRYTVSVFDDSTGRMFASEDVNLTPGSHRVDLGFVIRNPRLWWSAGLGEPHLYDFRVDVTFAGERLHSKITRTGLRSVRLVREPDRYGKSFYIELNGVPVFTKGANLIPCDVFLPRVTREIYEQTVRDAVDANMNMLRVWGGGVYEDDYFYELCDRSGILVWQDFMFACSIYPARDELLENIRLEAIDNVKRLRNHPCIALWCGGNECIDAWFNWGLKRRYTQQNPEYAQRIWEEIYDTYFVVLPEVVAEYDPVASYTPSSPYTDIDGRQDDTDGNRHYWATWQQGLPISTFRNEKSRHFTEYGFQSFPELVTVKTYAPDTTQWDIYSDVMMWHQRGGTRANGIIEKCLVNEYGAPDNFPEFVYMSQVLQGDAIKIAIEAHRRAMGYCMGSIYWQHNDCWPVASWSSRDYYGRWKALHYYARDAFRDILVSPVEEDDMLRIYVISDRLERVPGRLDVRVTDLEGNPCYTHRHTMKTPSNGSEMVLEISKPYAHNWKKPEEVVVHASFTDNKGNIYGNNYFFVPMSELKLPAVELKYQIDKVEGGFEVTVSTDKFARAVYLATDELGDRFSDNFFDLLPGASKTVFVTSESSRVDFESSLSIVSLN